MFSSIVVGTDGSSTAEEAVRQALEMARSTGATLHVVSAYRTAATMMAVPPEAVGIAAGTINSLQQDLERIATNIVSHIASQAEHAGVKCETYVIADDPADAILDVAESLGADLVFVGNRGHQSSRRFLLGSVAGKVAHHAPCHVMIVYTSG